jgi:hypothetical protein
MSRDKLLLLACIIMFALGVTGVTYGVVKNTDRTKETQELTQRLLTVQRGVCVLRDNLDRQVDQTQDYLKKHPGPEPFPGVTRQTLLINLARQQETLKALALVDCK